MTLSSDTTGTRFDELTHPNNTSADIEAEIYLKGMHFTVMFYVGFGLG